MFTELGGWLGLLENEFFHIVPEETNMHFVFSWKYFLLYVARYFPVLGFFASLQHIFLFVVVVESLCVWLFCDPMDSSPPGYSGISQERILEWVAISFSRAYSQPRDWTFVCCIAGGFFTPESGGSNFFVQALLTFYSNRLMVS